MSADFVAEGAGSWGPAVVREWFEYAIARMSPDDRLHLAFTARKKEATLDALLTFVASSLASTVAGSNLEDPVMPDVLRFLIKSALTLPGQLFIALNTISRHNYLFNI